MKVLITGGGIGGLTAALCLAGDGHDVELFEQAPEFSEVGAGLQLSPNCTRVLHYLGLEPALREAAFLPEGTQFRDWRSGRVIAERPLGETVVAEYGYPYYHMHRGDLLRVLVNAAQQAPGIILHTGARVIAVEQDAATVQLSLDGATCGHNVSGDVLIGADGIHSFVRSTLWGDAQPTFTGNIAWRAMVPVERLPADLVRPMSTVWWGPHKHFVHYYVRRGELVNCVCVVEKTGWEIESWTEPGEYDELKNDFAGWHNDIQTLIDCADRESLYKWALYDRPPMPQWGEGRVTLLGDACHPTLPFMAQGAAMAIEDGAVLMTCLRRKDTIASNLQHYEQLRRPRTAGIQTGSRRNASVFHMTGIKAWLRNRTASKAGERSMANLFRYDALNTGS